MPSIIQELAAALGEEIVFLQKYRGGTIAKVFNGKFIHKLPNGFLYVFHLENYIVSLDDTPAKIEIGGKEHLAQVLLVQGLEVEIAINIFCGEFIAEANLQANPWYLLELLKNKLLEPGKRAERFKLSNILFSRGVLKSQTNACSGECRYSPSISRPNLAQQQAIQSSFQKSFSIIWGPPGTGKTTVIAKLIEAHLNANRKVLLVSHANNAVDQALMGVVKQMKTTSYYHDGELVRLGAPTDAGIYKTYEDNYEMVLMDRIANKLGESLLAEKMQLLEKKTEIDARINDLKSANALVSLSVKLIEQYSNTEQAIQQYSNEMDQTEQQLKQLGQSQQFNQCKLKEARSAGFIKRIVKRLNPQDIQKEIDKTTIIINSRQRQAAIIAEKISACQKVKIEVQKNIDKVQLEKDVLFNRLRISSAERMRETKKALDSELQEILKRTSDIDKSIDELQKSILNKARLVATTLTKTFSDKKIDNLSFDVLIIDEASMAPLPYVYWAAGLSKQFITIVGDFMQLPPIANSRGPLSKKWLARSIFSVLGIDTVEDAVTHPLVTLLDTQYRMVPEIAEIPKDFFYGGKLINGEITETKYITEGITQKPLVLIKTDLMNPWCCQMSRSRFNLYNALVSVALAKKTIDKGFTGKIGIITPYAAQARLSNRIAKDWGLDKLYISTIHKFQGGEKSVIIFDTVEALGVEIAQMLDSTKVDSDADLLLNVAITRAESKFYLIAHTNHLLSKLKPNSSLAKLIRYVEKNGEIKESNNFVDNYLVTDFEKYIKLPPVPRIIQNNEKYFTEKNFWQQFKQDLNGVEKRLIIYSPFLSIRRSDHFMERFRTLCHKGIQVSVCTRPINEQTGNMVYQAEVVIKKLRAIGVNVVERSNMHQKIAIIDGRIAWHGSLNILSHSDTGEQMCRLEGQSTVKELVKILDRGQNNYSKPRKGRKA